MEAECMRDNDKIAILNSTKYFFFLSLKYLIVNCVAIRLEIFLEICLEICLGAHNI